METALQSILSLTVIAEFIIGNLSNGFIVLIHCIDWANGRKLSSVNQIFTALAIFRIGLLWEMLIYWFATLCFSSSFIPGTEIRILSFAWIVTNHFSSWLATILSIFYLLKIANFSSPVFLYLKWRVKKVILAILLGNLFFLLLNLIQINVYINDWSHRYERNTTWNSRMRDFTVFSGLTLFTMSMFTFIPFTVALVSSLLLIFSLWKHLKNMQLNSKRPSDPSTNAHINALKTVVSFLLLYFIFFLSFLIAWVSKMMQKKLVFLLAQIIGFAYPSSHSFILILGNSRLRQPFLLVLVAEVWAER
ncbi:LOW QUALITY PROTEIN: taste receptor type 2 member 13 [Dasypus novemcinctus]|uniref:LOW QUALITY PROTEIN: taste receptor type 2 member 13 n=1 Tax=Dasypus novemcinctus TaxID=9361 RepID=UPI00265F4DCF|nr:LOW QUALITY PROTEIN: taste receptor type 2 member 13 [Dasypus novemcinctus]